MYPYCSMEFYYSVPYYGWIVFHCRNISHFVYPFTIWWTSGTVFNFGLLWIMLFWIVVYKFLYGHLVSFLLSIYLVVWLLDHMITLFHIWETTKLYSKAVKTFCIPISNIWGFSFLHIRYAEGSFQTTTIKQISQ